MQTRNMRIKVKPSAHEAGLEQLADGTWLARVKSPPVAGKANAELIALMAKYFKVRKRDLTVTSGASGRIKLVQISGGS